MGFGSSSNSSVSGYQALPSELQQYSLGWFGNLANNYTGSGGQQQQNQAQQGLTNLANTDTSQAENYLSNILSPSYLDLTQNPEYQALANQYQTDSQKALGSTFQQANQAGAFDSSYAGEAANQATNQIQQDFANATGQLYTTQEQNQSQALNDYLNLLTEKSNLYSSALSGSQTSFNQLLQLLSALSGTQASSSGFNVSLS